jgi:hypothetical protein
VLVKIMTTLKVEKRIGNVKTNMLERDVERGMMIQEIPGDPQEIQETKETPGTPEEIQGETHGTPNSKELELLLHHMVDKDHPILDIAQMVLMGMGGKNIHLPIHIMLVKLIQVSSIHSIHPVNTLLQDSHSMVMQVIQTNPTDMVYLPLFLDILSDMLDMYRQSAKEDMANQDIKPQALDITASLDMEAKIPLELIHLTGIIRLIIALVSLTESVSVHHLQVIIKPRMDFVRSANSIF